MHLIPILSNVDMTRSKALSKYSDKTVARDLIDELRSYGGHPENLVSSCMQLKNPLEKYL